MEMYTRTLKPPPKSFFLFGPRGTGKSTWVKQLFPEATYFDLLRANIFLRLQQDPASFRKQVEGLDSQNWIVIDEISFGAIISPKTRFLNF